jgi:hypothetical protein
MFRQLAKWYAEQATNAALTAGNPAPTAAQLLADSTRRVFNLHPLQLLRFMEEVWAYRKTPALRPDLEVPEPLLNGLVPGLQSGIRDDLLTVLDDMYLAPLITRTLPVDPGADAEWDHLIYAYLIENTRIFDIFRRVLFEYRVGERLEVPSPDTHRWLRTTEDLFFRDLPSGAIGALTSSVRADLGSIRRNAYYRLFGIDLNHGREDGSPYAYVKPSAANKLLISVFEDFLREVWIASENFANTSGTNPKDDAAIATYARDLQDMLTARRENGNLAREEFVFVTMFAWFHLTVESDNSVVTDLKGTAGSPEERLRKIGERVGLPPHVHAESFFRLSTRMSSLFKQIERGAFSDASTVSGLYTQLTGGNPLRDDMLDIINQWSTATGRDMKARRTTVTPRTVIAPSNGAVRRPVGVAPR